MESFWDLLPGFMFIAPLIGVLLFAIWIKAVFIMTMVRIMLNGGVERATDNGMVSVRLNSYDYDEDGY